MSVVCLSTRFLNGRCCRIQWDMQTLEERFFLSSEIADAATLPLDFLAPETFLRRTSAFCSTPVARPGLPAAILKTRGPNDGLYAPKDDGIEK
jgi:hypothetical protein